MARVRTPEQVNQEEAYLIMQQNHFSGERRRTWTIWGSKHQVCPQCEAEAYTPCVNMAPTNRGKNIPVKWPHEKRVDWSRILIGLAKRGLK